MKAGTGGGPGAGLGMPVSAWPEPDRLAWVAAFKDDLFLEKPPLATRMAPRTKIKVETCYARWLVWLTMAHPGCLAEPAASRATRERVLEYLHMLKGELALGTVFGYACRLRDALEIIAPTVSWSWFGPIVASIKVHAEKVPRPYKTVVEVQRLVALGGQLMQCAEEDSGLSEVERAETFRNGLMIAFLALRPLRRDNMVTLLMGESFRETGSGFTVLIEAGDAKTRVPLDFSVPDRLAPFMRHYLTLYRPVLDAGVGPEGQHSAHLWLARSGQQLPSDTFADMISRETTRAFGERLTPHKFRHSAATAIATLSPEEFGIIRDILGHATLRTAELNYVHATGIAAANAFQAVVRDRRQENG